MNETTQIERTVRFRAVKVWRKVESKSQPKVITLAGFHPFTTVNRRKKPNPEVEARCDPSELEVLAKELGEGITLVKEKITAQSSTPQLKLIMKVSEEDKYEKLMIYAVVRQSMRNPLRANRLKDIVKDLGAYEAHFWASIFKEIFSRTTSRLELYRSARAFKTLYHLI